MTLKNPTAAELNTTFAEKVAGWTGIEEGWPGHDAPAWVGVAFSGITAGGERKFLPDFTTRADAVLPWLEKVKWSRSHQGTVWINLNSKNQVNGWPEKTSFPRAAVLALLRAHGVEVEFT